MFSFRTKYPITALIFELRANTIKPRIGLARRTIGENGEESYQLKHDPKHSISAKSLGDIYTGSNVELLPLFSPQVGEYLSLTLIMDMNKLSALKIKRNEQTGSYDIDGDGKIDIKLNPENLRFWHVQAKKWVTQRFAWKSLLDRWAPFLAIFMSIFLLGIYWKMWAGDMEKMTGSIAQIANSVAESAKTLKGCQIANIPPPPPG